MRENCTSGSVRGEGGNILTYSACGFEDATLFIERMKTRISIGLQGATEALQMTLRMFATAIGREGEPCRWRCCICAGTTVAHISPESPGLGLAVARS